MFSQTRVVSFVGRFAIALLVVSVLTAAAFVSGRAYGRHEYEQSHTIHIPNGVLQPVKQGQPANYLLIGSDVRPPNETPQEVQRYGSSQDVGGGGRSDVMMVLHVDPAARKGMLVSFPRDLIVDIPGHGRNLLNAAYTFGGPTLVIRTLQADFPPMRINHYLEVDFRSFKSVVDAIGHVRIWFPTPAHDVYTGLNVDQAGCVSLDGQQALNYVRSRHYNIPSNLQDPAPWVPSLSTHRSSGWIEDPLADLDRIPRQQYFLRTLAQAATDKTGSNPTKVFSLLNAVFSHLSHDQNLKYSELTALALTFRGFNPAKVEMSTLPIAPSPYPEFSGQVVPKFPDYVFVTNQLANFTPPEQPVVRAMSPDQVKIRVVNGSGPNNSGAEVLDSFVAAGFKSAGPAENADRNDYQTQVRYAPGRFRQGYTVAVAVGTLDLVQATSAKNTLGGDVLLIVGRDYSRLKHRFDRLPRVAHRAPAPTTTSTIARRPTTTTSTTTTTIPRTVDTRFVPVDPQTGGPLIGCPKNS